MLIFIRKEMIDLILFTNIGLFFMRILDVSTKIVFLYALILLIKALKKYLKS